jgi:hypothetical protein
MGPDVAGLAVTHAQGGSAHAPSHVGVCAIAVSYELTFAEVHVLHYGLQLLEVVDETRRIQFGD